MKLSLFIVGLFIVEWNFAITPAFANSGYIGCYVDTEARDLTGPNTFTNTNSIQNCRKSCQGFTYFGLQYAGGCTCSNSYGRHGKADENSCDMKCPGNNGEICGGTYRNSIYRTDGQESGYVGCYVDTEARDLTGPNTFTNTNSIQNCRRSCQGFTYFGLQYAGGCTCSNSFGRHGKADENTCDMKCPGNTAQICGGTWRNSIYRTDAQDHETRGYIGCYVDAADRDLTGRFTTTGTNSIPNCRKACQGFTYFGLQYTSECFCSNSYGKHGKADESNCNMKCSGNNAQMCGGRWRNSVYRTDG